MIYVISDEGFKIEGYTWLLLYFVLWHQMGVSKNNGTPKSSIFHRIFHYFHHPFWDIPLFLG